MNRVTNDQLVGLLRDALEREAMSDLELAITDFPRASTIDDVISEVTAYQTVALRLDDDDVLLEYLITVLDLRHNQIEPFYRLIRDIVE